MSLETIIHKPKIEIARTMREAIRAKEAMPISEATGVILCGGYGQRVRDITQGEIIKPLIPVAGNEVLIDNSLNYMREAGIKKIYFLTTEFGVDPLKHHTRRDRTHYDGVDIYVDDQPPSGWLFSLQKLIRDKDIKTPIVKASGDEGYDSVDVFNMYEAHTKAEQPITCLLTDRPSPGKHKMWLDENRRVTKIEGRPFLSEYPGSYTETGLWVIDPSQFSLLQRSMTWADVIKTSFSQGNLYGEPASVNFWGVNTPADLARVRKKRQK